MKRIYRLLVILMGLIVFIGAYVLLKQEKFSQLDQFETKPSSTQFEED